jgi:hypothetical protein
MSLQPEIGLPAAHPAKHITSPPQPSVKSSRFRDTTRPPRSIPDKEELI